MIAGVIPGNVPAVVVLRLDGRIDRVAQAPYRTVETPKGPRHHIDADAFADLLRQCDIERAVVERVGVLAEPGAAHALAFAAGIIEGVLATLKVERTTVSRKQWRDDLFIPDDYWSAVRRANDLTVRHWPHWTPQRSVGGHRQQLAALLALHAMQCSHGAETATA